MRQSKEEYLMLRDEIIHLDSVINNTISFFYIFMATFLAFALTKSDTIYILLSHIVIIPSYLIVIGKNMAIYRISAYLVVFHEGETFNWETRLMKLKRKRLKIFSFINLLEFPFIFVNMAVFILYCCRSQWEIPLSIYEIGKLAFEIIILLIFIILMNKNRKISVNDYIEEWIKIK